MENINRAIESMSNSNNSDGGVFIAALAALLLRAIISGVLGK
jgi:hypothetical protein